MNESKTMADKLEAAKQSAVFSDPFRFCSPHYQAGCLARRKMESSKVRDPNPFENMPNARARKFSWNRGWNDMDIEIEREKERKARDAREEKVAA